MIYDYLGNVIDAGSQKQSEPINLIIAAHRGCHVEAAQNSAEAIQSAAEFGFNYVEIDIRKTADNVYILAHDATMTLYDSGVSTVVSFASQLYADIKDYTLDAEGKYRLCTLSAAFHILKTTGLKAICDRKAGSNDEIVELATQCGVTDLILLSYYTFAEAVNDMELLARYPWIPIRVYPSGVSAAATLFSELKNKCYADINATTVNNDVINNALAFGMPIIFSGCTQSNYKVWSVLARGVMANLDLNITPEQFLEYIDNDFDKSVTITPSSESIAVGVSSTASLTASTNDNTAAGYLYGYCLDPTIASVEETTFGQSAAFTISGLKSGTTNLRLFTGTGAFKDVTVTVS